MKCFLFCLSAALLTLTPSHAVIIVIAPTSTTAGSLEITETIHFPITQSGEAVIFVFQGWVTSDETSVATFLSPNLSFSLNDNNLNRSAGIIDSANAASNDIGPNDGYLAWSSFNPVEVVVGDTLTLSVGTYSIAAASNFNPQATQTFTGNMFVSNIVGNRLSEIVAVPEPSLYTALLGLVSLALLLRRRRA
ncbi:MAG: PEP-CTERM sorting domain-containing protein [Opitutales bacterium]|nr:PEP-CTERM sorting domain-containing protein [Opitutales bacterium]